jgi:hypothetical protein
MILYSRGDLVTDPLKEELLFTTVVWKQAFFWGIFR